MLQDLTGTYAFVVIYFNKKRKKMTLQILLSVSASGLSSFEYIQFLYFSASFFLLWKGLE